MKRKRFILLVIVGIFAAASLALAKEEPYVEDPGTDWGSPDDPTAMSENVRAFALAGRLGTYGDIDAFTFTITQPESDVPVNVMVPMCGDHFATLYPTVAIVGPGLDSANVDQLPFAVADGMGALILSSEQNAVQRPHSSWDLFGVRPYLPDQYTVDLAEAGTYTLALWDPNGNVGAYMIEMVAHPEAMDESRPDREREAASRMIESHEWYGADCNTSIASAECPATASGETGDVSTLQMQPAMGEGDAVMGVVRDSATCLPIAGAQVSYWTGEADAQAGYVLTNGQGAFRIVTSPAEIKPDVRVQVNAEGYNPVALDPSDETTLALNLVPLGE